MTLGTTRTDRLVRRVLGAVSPGRTPAWSRGLLPRGTTVQVVGAGHVGLVLALHLNASGAFVDLVDRPDRVSLLERGEPGFHEPGVTGAFRAAVSRGTISLRTAPQPVSRVTFICVGDVHRRGRISADPVLSVVKQHRGALDGGVLCVRSTVPVGTTRRVAAMLPRAAVLCTPEFLREGSALVDLADEHEVIVGSEPGRDVPEEAVHLLTSDGRAISVCSWETAETTKILRNALNALRVAFINEAYTAIEESDVDPSFVAERVIDHSSPGRYGRPGLPAGGSCLPAAVEHLLAGAHAKGRPVPLLETYSDSAEQRLRVIAEGIMESRPRRVLVLGLSYRPDTDDMDCSWAVRLATLLAGFGVEVRAVDPYVTTPPAGVALTSLADGLAWADHVVRAVAHPPFTSLRVREPAGWTDLTGRFEYGRAAEPAMEVSHGG